MNISSNSLISLDYHPAKDILEVELPDIRKFSLSEVERSLQLVVEAVQNYDIKKMFLDSSKAVIEVDDEEYKKVVMKFSMDLTKTRLRWLARISSPLPAQEQRASMVVEEIRQSTAFPVEFRNFQSRAEAMEWLEANS